MRQMHVMALIVVLIGCSSSGGGGEKDKGKKEVGVETLPGCESPICVGSYVRTCSEDRKHYKYEYCYLEACKNGMCKPPGCTDPGAAKCESPSEVSICSTDLTQIYSEECAEGTKCLAGVCVPEPCEKGTRMCGWKASLKCTEDGTWKVSECAPNQYCDGVSFTCTDIDPFCAENPLGVRCVALNMAKQCDYTGAAMLVKCSGNDVCVDGFCQPRVKGVVYEFNEREDSSQTPSEGPDLEDMFMPPEEEEVTVIDLGKVEPPPLEKPRKAWVTINGGQWEQEQIKFTSGLKAGYVVKDKDLQVKMARGELVLEVHFMGIEENVVGAWSSEEPGAVNVKILFNDGTNDPKVVQWKWSSVSYEATLDQFDGVGGRVIGTFSGILEADATGGGGPTLELTDGYFDVPRDD